MRIPSEPVEREFSRLISTSAASRMPERRTDYGGLRSWYLFRERTGRSTGHVQQDLSTHRSVVILPLLCRDHQVLTRLGCGSPR